MRLTQGQQAPAFATTDYMMPLLTPMIYTHST